MSKPEENFSIDKLRNGDRAEFARVVDAYSKMIYRLGLKMLHNPQDAEDILQETFIKAYKNFKDFKGNSKVSTWLYSIASNEALMLLRKRKKLKFSLATTLSNSENENQEISSSIDWCCLPEKELMSAEAVDYLDQAVDQLSEANRAVFLLRDVEDLSTFETAEVLGISESAVKTRLSRGRLHLRELLSEYYGQKLKSTSWEREIPYQTLQNGKII
ncbi:MAG: sigma-70 family RNA polymerase sigma factor [Chloroflexota bacterium]|nr:sigma-70 family RNA polymerase sigma factor [Chloroflexota bacterium]